MLDMTLEPAEQAFFEQRGATEPAQPTETPAEPQSAPAAPETAAAEPVEQLAEPHKEPTLVPVSAVIEERRARQELQRKLEEVERRNEERLQQVLAAMQQQRQQQEPPPPLPPSFDDDPAGAAKYGLEQTQRQLAETQNVVRQLAEQQRVRETMAAIDRHISQTEAVFAAQQPDYPQAVQFLTQKRKDVYRAMGAQESEVDGLLENERRNFVAHAIGAKMNVPDAVYKLARTLGYVPTAVAPAPGERIAQLQAGAQAAQSVGAMAGKPAQQTTMQSLLEMSDEEFRAATEKDPALFARLMGGR